MLRVYIASWFASKDLIKERAKQLTTEGIEITSRWLDEKVASNVQVQDIEDEYNRDTARDDIQDILTSTVVVLNVPSKEDLKSSDIPTASWARGGRHFEAGLQYATMLLSEYLPERIWMRGQRYLILVGHKENVFHYLSDLKENGKADDFELPGILIFPTWELTKDFLVKLSKETHTAAVGM